MLSLKVFTQDSRFALRVLRRNPSFAFLAAATLAVGIGASTAIFSLVDRLLFRSLPYAQGNRLVSVGITGPIDDNEFMIGRSYVDWRQRQSSFASLTSMLPAAECDLGQENPVRIRCISVERNFLPTLGVLPILGRNFTRGEDTPHAPLTALLSYSLWKSRFAASPRVLGQTLDLDGSPTRIVGVLPSTFEMPQLGEADILLPEQLDETANRRAETGTFLRCFARLKNGVSIKQAREQMQPLFQASLLDAPPMLRKEIHLTIRSLRDRQIHNVRLASWLLLGTVLALLLIACGNVANLLLARAVARSRELAMRAALGAGRARLMQQSLIESLLIGLSGGVIGLALAWGMLRILIRVSPNALLRLNQAKLDLRVFLFALGVSLMAALLFGVAPAFHRPRLEDLTGGRVAGLQRGLLRHSLVSFQIAVSLILLTGASLFARSLLKLESQRLGIEPEHVLSASFVLPVHRYAQPSAQDAFYRQLESRLSALPGVSAFALSDSIPPAGGIHARPFSNMRVAGRPPLPTEGGMVAFRYVSPGYFRAFQIHMLAGRLFRESDRVSSQYVVILSANLAQRIFGKENAVGRQIALDGDAGPRTQWSTIVGVAADVKNDGMAVPPEPEYYRIRAWKSPQLGRSAVAIVRTALPNAVVSRMFRHLFAALDPTLPINVESLSERIRDLTQRPRFLSVLIGIFALMGLLLAIVGLYGVMSYLVNQQTREIGIRMAIGATPWNIAALILKFAVRWTSLGLIAGLIGSYFVTKLIGGLLFAVSPEDPAAFLFASTVLVTAALLAAWLPSFRASRVEPAISLRHD